MAGSAELRQWAAAGIASMSFLMTGMFMGWPSPWVSKLRAGQTDLDLSQSQISWAISLVYLGSVLSPHTAGRMMDRCGRRAVLRACSTLALASWLILAVSTDVIGVYIARILGGLWIGVCYCVTSAYLCEIADPRIRGALNTMFALMVYLGVLFEYVIGPLLSYTVMSLVSAGVPLVYLVGMSQIPESPYFFLMRENREEAKKSLQWLRCKDDVEEELNAISESVTSNMKNKGTLSDLISTPGSRRALFMAEMVAFLQRMSGSSVMVAYISSSLPKGGWVTGDQCAIMMCFLWLIFGVWSTIFIDRLGRKPLLAISCTGCVFATGGLAIWFFLDSQTSTNLDDYKMIPLICYLLYAVFFPIGLGCTPTIIQGEMFPSNVKALASGITTIVTASVSFFNNKLYQVLADSWGMYINYFYFTISSMYGIYFALYILLETRNKSLAQIQLELAAFDQVADAKKNTSTSKEELSTA